MATTLDDLRRARMRIAGVALQWYEADAKVQGAERSAGLRAYQEAKQEAHCWLGNLRDVIEQYHKLEADNGA